MDIPDIETTQSGTGHVIKLVSVKCYGAFPWVIPRFIRSPMSDARLDTELFSHIFHTLPFLLWDPQILP